MEIRSLRGYSCLIRYRTQAISIKSTPHPARICLLKALTATVGLPVVLVNSFRGSYKVQESNKICPPSIWGVRDLDAGR